MELKSQKLDLRADDASRLVSFDPRQRCSEANACIVIFQHKNIIIPPNYLADMAFFLKINNNIIKYTYPVGND